MRVFLAGATGVVGRQLVPLLLAEGHAVVGTTSRPTGMTEVSALGAEPVLMDGLDLASVRRAVLAAEPEVVVHQMTALGGSFDLRHFEQTFAGTNRLRTEGGRHRASLRPAEWTGHEPGRRRGAPRAQCARRRDPG